MPTGVPARAMLCSAMYRSGLTDRQSEQRGHTETDGDRDQPAASTDHSGDHDEQDHHSEPAFEHRYQQPEPGEADASS